MTKATLKSVPTGSLFSSSVAAPEVTTMSLKEWVSVPTFFSQRNHFERAASTRHIRRLSAILPTHLVVAMVVFNDGKRFKVDGHTRAEFWSSKNCVNPPSRVTVLVYRVGSSEEARAIYNSIDGREAMKTAPDAIFSALRELNMIPKTKALATGKFGTALNIAYGKTSNIHFTKRAQIEGLRKEIIMFDSLLPEGKMLRTPSMAAAFLSIRRDGEKALKFWRAVNEGSFCDGSDTNAHECVREYIEHDNAVGNGGDNGYQSSTGRLLHIYEQWAKNPNLRFDLNDAIAGIDGGSVLVFFRKQVSL